MYAKAENGAIAQYPYTEADLRSDNPNVSFPVNLTDEVLAAFNTVRVIATGKPEHDALLQSVVEDVPVWSSVRNRWEQAWRVIDATLDEIAERQHALQDELVIGTQKRLDAFAQTRGYDSMLSACTYAQSPTPRFAADGQYCVQMRDATWAKLYELLEAMQAGTRPMPHGYADVESELPPLSWPQ